MLKSIYTNLKRKTVSKLLTRSDLAQAPMPAQASESVKRTCSSIERCLNIFRQCLTGANNDSGGFGPDRAEGSKIKQSISKLSNVTDLLLLCRLLHAVYPDVCELENRAIYKRVEFAEYVVARNLSQRSDTLSREGLKMIKAYHKGNATFSLTLDELIAKQQKAGSH